MFIVRLDGGANVCTTSFTVAALNENQTYMRFGANDGTSLYSALVSFAPSTRSGNIVRAYNGSTTSVASSSILDVYYKA